MNEIIVLSFNNNFIEIASVFLQSLLKHLSYTPQIYVLYSDLYNETNISSSNMNFIKQLYSNIIFYNVKVDNVRYLEILFRKTRLQNINNLIAYFSMVPFIDTYFLEYDTICFCDVDMLVTQDISEIFRTQDARFINGSTKNKKIINTGFFIYSPKTIGTELREIFLNINMKNPERINRNVGRWDQHYINKQLKSYIHLPWSIYNYKPVDEKDLESHKIVHFMGKNGKPWEKNTLPKFLNALYLRYLEELRNSDIIKENLDMLNNFKIYI